MNIFRRAKFCGSCGRPLVEVDEPVPFSTNEMWRTRECESLLGPRGHDWDVIKQWSIGPAFDRATGKPRR